MSHLTDDDRPSSLPLVAETPRWRWRHLGVAAMVAVFIVLGWSAWHYTHRVPAIESNDVPVPASR